MDNTEQQAGAITEMAQESAQAVEQATEAASGKIAIQDTQLGNRIDITA